LEFEKACRGPKSPVYAECAWGGGPATAVSQTGHSGTDGSGTETATPTNANCNFNSGIAGGIRSGIYYTSTNSTRQQAGSTYYGVMEMSGDLDERTVSVGSASGRVFTASNGDGSLTSGGDADAATWPGTAVTGTGLRGGDFYSATVGLRASGRYDVNYAYLYRHQARGFRGVRLAP
jgi:hypothetical protein